MRKNFPYVGSVYLLLITDDKILLQRRCNTNFEDGNYGVPAGHMEGGETARAACAREIKEEIGINIKPSDLKLVHISHRKAAKDERMDFFFTTKMYEGEVKNCEPDKCDDLQWFDLEALPVNTIEYVKAALDNYKAGKFYSEWGW